MSSEQVARGRAFADLHRGPGAFIIPNPWDIGSAKMLAHLGFRALATTSAGFAFSQGLRDGRVGRDRMLAHCVELASAVPLPFSADLENGFADAPEGIAETILLASNNGLVGCSIEDATGRSADPIYEFGLAVDRIRAAVAAVRSIDFPFVLTARAENFLHGRPDLDDTIRRLQAFQEAGADVLYAPGLSTNEQIDALISSVDRPVNVLMGMGGVALSLAQLSERGVRRISTGAALYRAAMAGFIDAAREMRDRGTFTFAGRALPSGEITKAFGS